VVSSGSDWRGSVLLLTAPVPGSLATKNALEYGHFSALGAGLFTQPHRPPPLTASHHKYRNVC